MKTICNDCETNLHWDAFYDAVFCPNCNEWLTKTCGYSHPDCYSHCDTRPERPLNLIYEKTDEGLAPSM